MAGRAQVGGPRVGPSAAGHGGRAAEPPEGRPRVGLLLAGALLVGLLVPLAGCVQTKQISEHCLIRGTATGGRVLVCPDGASVPLPPPGHDYVAELGCTVVDHGDGTATITCANGSTARVGALRGDLTLTGGFTVDSPADVAVLRPYSRVTGGLTIQATALTALALPALTSVGGDLTIVGNPELQEFDLRGLRAVGGALAVARNPALPQCLADQLLARLGKVATADLSDNRGDCTCAPTGDWYTPSCP